MGRADIKTDAATAADEQVGGHFFRCLVVNQRRALKLAYTNLAATARGIHLNLATLQFGPVAIHQAGAFGNNNGHAVFARKCHRLLYKTGEAG